MTETPEDSYTDEQRFQRLKDTLGDESYSNLMARLKERFSYSPVILFMGKTGVGKSSTCNALFGAEMFKVDDVAACTREIQVEDLELSDQSLTLVDVPGVGENQVYTQ
jgi:predicted GTPase